MTSGSYPPPGGEVFVLVIQRVVPADSGEYVCEINSDPVVRSFHELRGGSFFRIFFCVFFRFRFEKFSRFEEIKVFAIFFKFEI